MMRLAVERLHVRYSSHTILDDISLSFQSGESVAIVGPNGSGKSTLMKLVAGVERPQRGAVILDGQDLHAWQTVERVRRIGYVPQSFNPFWDHTVQDLLELGAVRVGFRPSEHVRQIAEANGVEDIRDRRWSVLSGGERARVLIAMVTAINPEALLADEPGASLDIRHRLRLLAGLAAERREALTVVVLHDLDLAFRFFDRVVLVGGGKIVADGPADVIVKDERLDATFGVRFERIMVDGKLALYPSFPK